VKSTAARSRLPSWPSSSITTRWLDAGAQAIVVEARESAQQVGLFDASGGSTSRRRRHLPPLRDGRTIFEAPNKRSQFDSSATLATRCTSATSGAEVLRVEIYRRGYTPMLTGTCSLHGRRGRLNMNRTFAIDSLPEARAHRSGDTHAIVVVDVFRATTVVVTALAAGHRVYPGGDPLPRR